MMLKTRSNSRRRPSKPRQKFRVLLAAAIATAALAFVGAVYGVFLGNARQEQPISSDDGFSTTLAEVPEVPAGYFRYGGATAFAPLRSATVVAQIQQAHPLFNIVYTESIANPLGSRTEIERLINGEIGFVQSSRPLEISELEAAEARGFTLEQIPIAIDGIAIYVNPQLSVARLSLAQLQDIYAGEIKNWQAVGGADLAIVPLSLPSTSGTAAVFQAKVMEGDEFAPTVKIAPTPTQAIRRVSQIPGGIGYASAAVVAAQETVKLLPLAEAGEFVAPVTDTDANSPNLTAFADDSYPLIRALYVIVRRDGTENEQAGVAYANLLLSQEGQRLIEQAGFVPVRGILSSN